MEDKICICGHEESNHVTGRKDGVSACMDCIEEGIEDKNSTECEGFTEKLQSKCIRHKKRNDGND